MTERKRSPEEHLEEMINKNVKFQVLEILTLLGSVGGTVAILLKQSAAFATAPLALSVFLNLLNRRKLDQLTRQQTLLDITEVQRRLSAEIQGIRSLTPEKIGDIDPANAAQVHQALSSLSETVSALDMKVQQSGSIDLSQMEEEFTQIRNHQLDLSQALEAVNQQLRNLPQSVDSAQFEQELTTLKERIEQIQVGTPDAAAASGVDLEAIRGEFQGLLEPMHQQIGAMESRFAAQDGTENTASVDVEPLRAEFQQMMEPVQRHLADLESRLAEANAAAAPVDVEPLRAEFQQTMEPVQRHLAELEARMAEQSPVPAPAAHPEELQQVQQQVGSLNEKLDHVVAQLSAEIAGFQQSVEQAQGQLEGLQQQVQATQNSPAPAAMDPAAIHQEMQGIVGPLQEQLVALENKLNAVPTVDPKASQIQAEQMVSLQNQLNMVTGQLDEVTSQISEEFSKLPQIVEDQVQQKVATLQPAPPDSSAQSKASELDDILAGINFD